MLKIGLMELEQKLEIDLNDMSLRGALATKQSRSNLHKLFEIATPRNDILLRII